MNWYSQIQTLFILFYFSSFSQNHLWVSRASHLFIYQIYMACHLTQNDSGWHRIKPTIKIFQKTNKKQEVGIKQDHRCEDITYNAAKVRALCYHRSPGYWKKTHFWVISRRSHRMGLTSSWKQWCSREWDATPEEAHLLGPFRWNSFTDGTFNMSLLPDLMGQIDAIGKRWYLR